MRGQQGGSSRQLSLRVLRRADGAADSSSDRSSCKALLLQLWQQLRRRRLHVHGLPPWQSGTPASYESQPMRHNASKCRAYTSAYCRQNRLAELELSAKFGAKFSAIHEVRVSKWRAVRQNRPA